MTSKNPLPVTVLLGDPSLPDLSKPGGAYTADDHDQVVRMRSALCELAEFEFDFWNDHTSLLHRLRDETPTFALNFCDTGFRNQAAFEPHLAAYLEMLEIPYSGSGPMTLGLCYDKAHVRAIAKGHGIPVPWELFIDANENVPAPLDSLSYPAFIKPNRGDGSVGITAKSIVNNLDEARAYVELLRETLPGSDILIQEFLAGDEYSLGVVGNPGIGFDVLPAVEVDYSALDPSLPRLLDYGSKTDPNSPYWTDLAFRRAQLTPAELEQMVSWCHRLFERLGLRDYARLDFRRSASGEIMLMEVNPNPAWCHDGKLAYMSGLRGESHAMLLNHIIMAGCLRTGVI